MKIAMVCLGNICRSPMAAAVATEMVARAGLADRISVESFGTAGYHRGEGINPGAAAALQRRGWPSEGHRARRITPADVQTADLLLVADHSNLADVRRLARNDQDRAKVRLLRSFDPACDPSAGAAHGSAGAAHGSAGSAHGSAGAASDLEVPDPWGGNARDFDQALDLIEGACAGLVAHLAASVH
ncbi:MAG: low molecular weight protein-tyrosine-phosphatase [Acidimicrobiales bacterium]